jgi:hypothetical protein
MTSGKYEIATSIEEVGWRATAIDDASPPFVYTRGLTTHHNHPELIILGLQSKTAYPILHKIVAEIKKGRSFYDDVKYEDIIEGLLIAVRKVHTTQHEMYLADAMAYCRQNEKILIAKQVFWPDKSGFFPFEINCDPKVAALQPRLELAATAAELKAFKNEFGIS